MILHANCVHCRRNSNWEDKPSASSHREQEESHAALQPQEITLLLMTQVSWESSCKLSARAAGLCNTLPCRHTQQHISFVCPYCTSELRDVFCPPKTGKHSYSISPSFCFPSAYTLVHPRQMKRHKSVKLPLDDKLLHRAFPQQHVQRSA